MVSKSFPSESWAVASDDGKAISRLTVVALWVQIVLVYGVLQAALWTPPGRRNLLYIGLEAFFVLLFVLFGPYSAHTIGVTRPSRKAFVLIILSGVISALVLRGVAWVSGADSAPTHALPWRTAWQYAIWALVQQFMLQSFFFGRFESFWGSRWAVAASALLFATAHLPNPVLTAGTLLSGVFFCEAFRRYRSIFPLGVAHALLGLTMAASVSDALLHHMRVGIGYIQFR